MSHRAAVRRFGSMVAVVLVGAVVLSLPGTGAGARGPGDGADDGTRGSAAVVPFALVDDRDVEDRLPSPEDRYALAGGCYTLEAPGQGHVARAGEGLVLVADRAAAEPFHLQATRLGSYLLATNEGADTRWAGAWWDRRGYLSADALPLVGGLLGGSVGVAQEPSDAADWVVAAFGPDADRRVDVPAGEEQGYVLTLPGRGLGLRAAEGELGTADARAATPLRFHHVPDDDLTDDDANGTACADWPEVDTGTVGRPAPNPGGPAAEVQGFFEAHVHGMAFEFLGGRARCGRPWHPYGVEHALVDCEDHGPGGHGAALELVVSGTNPVTGHDPVGWPTFGYWPRADSLTHEQFYWRWLERAHHGGLRLMTNLLVDNTALCQAYPLKRNSCNEMDGVRLQAQRLYELQDYIDAQRGGPGEGWLRIVTTPVEARAAINAGRLAVVMGIEVSVLFDCGEHLDVPQCTPADIDERLQEVFDMGVRQMELVNKFDNALSGVTGDGGTTGVVVNAGNRHVTGHFWDMQGCGDTRDPQHEGHQHDKTQLNLGDDVPDGGRGEIDQLAGAILGTFGPTRGYVAPAYPKGPHCNTRGLTDLGRHLVRSMVAKGMVFDPDHMSAAAQREALDLIEHEIVPAERAAAAAEGRPPTQPAVISSHSWANDVVYQRIYALDGAVAPRTAPADRFADAWAKHRRWADAKAPSGHVFGLGYGADTNGFGGQPGRRSNPAERIDYATTWEAPIGGVRIGQQVSGVRRYDINADGVAHYGLFADWYREVELAADERHAGRGGGAAVMADMLAGSESYLRLWERAVYGANDCVADGSHLQVEDLHGLLGGDVEGFLRAAGQPLDRDGAAYVYCAEGPGGEVRRVRVAFDAAGRAVTVQR